MASSAIALLLFSLAVTAAAPQADRILDSINWPEEAPEWWPFRWPPRLPENAPHWWPEWLDWPPSIPQQWPDRPPRWPEHLPWPPEKPEDWPDRPSFWPDGWEWPPKLPEIQWPEEKPEWPDRPDWLPENLPWPPSLPDLVWPPPGVDPDNVPYIPSRDNEFHLFTRNNPAVSTPLVINNYNLLRNSYFDPSNPTVVLVHDIRQSAYAPINSILIPSYLSAADVNIILVDWSPGAWASDAVSTVYSVASSNFIARFLNWVSDATGADLEDFHLVGVGLGGFKVGFVGLRLKRQVGYITALDPPQGHEISGLLPPLSPNVAKYTEVIHTDQNSWASPLGHVDFYPNGGQYQPGCAGDPTCNRNRAIYFLGESIQTGGFTGVKCEHWRDVFSGSCYGEKTLKLGGIRPKTGSRGVFYLRTNADPPFSQG